MNDPNAGIPNTTADLGDVFGPPPPKPKRGVPTQDMINQFSAATMGTAGAFGDAFPTRADPTRDHFSAPKEMRRADHGDSVFSGIGDYASVFPMEAVPMATGGKRARTRTAFRGAPVPMQGAPPADPMG